MTATLPQISALTPAEARHVAAGIIDLYAELGFGWVKGGYFAVKDTWHYDSYQEAARACAMGAVKLAALKRGHFDYLPMDNVAFRALFGQDGLEDHELELLTDWVIAGNDSPANASLLETGLKNFDQYYDGYGLGYTKAEARRQYKIAKFGYTIGRMVADHFRSGS